MKYRKLGTTDLDVSVICLGTMTWGEQNNQDDGFNQMDYAFERGVNFLIQLRFILYQLEQKRMAKQKKLLVIGLLKTIKEKM